MYLRVIPRDLFNEANLLKCLGRLYIVTEGRTGVAIEHDGDAFDVRQYENSGAIYAFNVSLWVRGAEIPLWSPLNSRASWPLRATIQDDDVAVFDAAGNLSAEMCAFLESQ